MPLPPDSCGGNTQYPRNTHSAKMICSEECGILKCSSKQNGQRDRVGGQERRRRGRQDRDKTEDGQNAVTLP